MTGFGQKAQTRWILFRRSSSSLIDVHPKMTLAVLSGVFERGDSTLIPPSGKCFHDLFCQGLPLTEAGYAISHRLASYFSGVNNQIPLSSKTTHSTCFLMHFRSMNVYEQCLDYLMIIWQ